MCSVLWGGQGGNVLMLIDFSAVMGHFRLARLLFQTQLPYNCCSPEIQPDIPNNLNTQTHLKLPKLTYIYIYCIIIDINPNFFFSLFMSACFAAQWHLAHYRQHR